MERHNYSVPLPLNQVQVTDRFFGSYIDLVRSHVIPYQWEAINDRIEGAAPSYCMRNFKTAAAITKVQTKEFTEEDKIASQQEFYGLVFQDSDFAKWIEAVGYSLITQKDEQLEQTADEAIDIVCAAQQPDGYLDTYYIINGLDKRFTNLRDNHELYCLGHMIEGAIAYYQGTQKDKLLKAMIHYVDFVDATFGPEPHKKHGYPGHEVIELALIKLYEITQDEKHLKLASYFIEERGKKPNYFEQEGNGAYWEGLDYKYNQADRPVREQTQAQGHAVRAVYLYAGMADAARVTEDETLYRACQTLWNNIVQKQMYITGAIGSSAYGEAFTFDYDLPNDTIYGETCAAIGLVFFARRMLSISPKGEYADVMERALYNGILSGMSLDGQSFFYVNPLEVIKKEDIKKDHRLSHVNTERQKWFGCACCPPNVARLLVSIADYSYTCNEDTFFTHLYIGSNIKNTLAGNEVTMNITCNYPWEEDIKVELAMEQQTEFTYALRIPGWCTNYTITINDQSIPYQLKDGYLYINRTWENEDVIKLHLDMKVLTISCNPKVRENIGKTAICRGPVVYCLEETDNGADLHQIYLNGNPKFTHKYEPDLLGGVVTITSIGEKLKEKEWDNGMLYLSQCPQTYTTKELKWVPYYAWANREPGEMIVWIHSL